MKKIKYIIYCLLLTITITSAQEKIEFSGKLVIVTGWANNLAISGHSDASIKIEEAKENEKKAYDYEISDNTITISLFQTCHTIAIAIPKKLDLKIDMENVVYETKFDHVSGKDWRALAISKMEGNVESKTDGYNVALDRIKGSVSVVSYGNISAVLPDLSNSELVSLDTYLGNVSLQVPSGIEANISMRAKSGKLDISRKFKITKTKARTKKKITGIINGGGIEIILHSEGGDVVSLLSTGNS